MKPKLRALATSVVALLWACIPATGGALAADPPAPVLTPLVADVLWAPRLAYGSDGQRHLVYELRLANPTPAAINLMKIDVIDAATQKTLLEVKLPDIGKRFSIGGRRGAEAASLAVGQFGVLFVHVPLAASANVPRAIAHRVNGLLLLQPAKEFTITVGETPVIDANPVILGPPLIGKGYLAGDGCCDTIRHVRALLPLNGRFTLAQRFAIDWEQADDQNLLVNGDRSNVRNYTIYGKDVIAVADGTVVATRNDLPDQPPGKLPDGLPIDEADGNFVVLDIGNGAFALYAHMQKGSVKVAAGNKVKSGNLLGKVGNTGNTSAPHLHFHVMDGPSPLLSNGIPYIINHFKMTAIDKAGTADFDNAESKGTPLSLTPFNPPLQKWNVLPMDLTVVEFSR
jgi:Peptidase family M23